MTAAEPQPAALPLPGGRDGAAVQVTPLLTATSACPEPWLHREEGRLGQLHALGLRVPREQWLRIPVQAFLVEHPGAGPLLIDTGFHSSVAAAPRSSLGRIGSLAFRDIEMTAAQAVPAQLRALGIDPGEVKTIVMTHLHLDHASGVSDFPGSTFVLSSREWEAAGEQGRLHGYVKRQFDHAFDWRTIDFEGADAGGHATFGRAVDLFGDGTLRLLFTPGHTHGHLSVLLRLRERDLLVCGDAAYTLRAFEQSHPPARMEDEHRWRRSLRELQLYVREHPDTVVVPGHDLPAFEALERVYE
ncbi:MAG: N-acyl homoserine lactonase family protein [Thermoleophilaceae bacterium]